MDSDATSACWARHQPAETYCAIVAIDDSAWKSACRGSWNASDLVEVHDDPPADERCTACVDVLRIDRGLAELAANAPEPLIDFEMVDLGELGGES